MNNDHINEHYYGDVTDPKTERARQRIHWICGQATGRDVLDIGCSQGIVCLILGREGFQCTGIDLESASLAVAQQALAKEDEIVRTRVSFQVADGSQLPFADESFDTVVLGEVLEHLTNPLRILREAKRVLRDGGRLIATVPYGLNAFPDHKCTYYPISFLELMQPLFRTGAIDTLNNYIIYAGVKDQAYQGADVRKESLFDDYVRLERSLEARCLEKERALLEARTTMVVQNKTLTAQAIAQGGRIKELEAVVAAGKKQIGELQADLEKAQCSTKALSAQMASVDAERIHLRAELAKAQAALATAEPRLASLEGENARLGCELAAAKSAGQEQVAQAEALYRSRLRERERHFQELLGKREAEGNRRATNQKIRDLVRATLPADARVLVISKGDDELLNLDGRHAAHFPQAVSGAYAGYHPKDAGEAIAHLEALKAKGAQFLLIPASSLWWLEYYGEFRAHLETNCRLHLYDERLCAIYELRPPLADARMNCRISVATGGLQQGSHSAVPQPMKSQVATSSPTSKRPPAPEPAPAPAASSSEARLGVILDEFTTGCLRPECRLLTFRPDNWRNTLERDRPDLLFVESVWRGNDGAWLYRVANYNRKMGDELADLLQWAQQQAIPSVFWNKEDPVHFDRFIDSARLFSHVFTTDADCIPKYRQQLGHDRVFALPFAAQPAIHNPLQVSPRDGAVCFAGTYYGKRHEERQNDMDYILRPAIPFGLEIYDRQHGVTGKGANEYRFPDIYQPCIKGRLDYDEMVKAYKQYRVFLNVNSVKQSPTMFSRRVSELLASGTPVISTYSLGIAELLGEDVVFFTESEADTRRHLERLLGDDDAWAQASVRGIRKVMREHTYGRRLREVFERVGITLPGPREPLISVIVRIGPEAQVDGLVPLLLSQTYRRFDVVLVSEDRLASSALDSLGNALSNVSIVNIVGSESDVFAQCLKASAAEYLAFLDLRDSYGPDYLMDHALAVMYSHADFLGKHTFCEIDAHGQQTLKQPGHEFKYVGSVPTGSLVVKKSALSKNLFSQAFNNLVFQTDDRQILSIDRFNYVQNVLIGNAVERRCAENALEHVGAHV